MYKTKLWGVLTFPPLVFLVYSFFNDNMKSCQDKPSFLFTNTSYSCSSKVTFIVFIYSSSPLYFIASNPDKIIQLPQAIIGSNCPILKLIKLSTIDNKQNKPAITYFFIFLYPLLSCFFCFVC